MKRVLIIASLLLAVFLSGCVTTDYGDDFTPIPSNPDEMV